MARRTVLFMAMLIMAGTSTAYAADGEFDGSFGIGGMVATGETASTAPDQVHEAVLGLPDGGTLYYGNSPLEIQRFTAAGVLDVAFGMGGKTQAPDPNLKLKSAGVMAVGSDGTIYAAAQATAVEGAIVCKFNAQGLPVVFADTQTSCTAVADFVNPFDPTAMTVDASGGLLVLSLNGSLVRFRSGGAVDVNFAPPTGQFALPPLIVGQGTRPADLTFDASGAIYVVGTSDSPVIWHAYATKLRVDANTGLASLDPNFHGGTPLEVACNGNIVVPGCSLASVDIAPGGSLVITGSYNSEARVIRLNAITGQATLPPSALPLPPDASGVAVRDAVLQQNGKLLVVGTTFHNQAPGSRIWLTRAQLSCDDVKIDANTFGPPFGFSSFILVLSGSADGQDVAIGKGRVLVAGHDLETDDSVSVVALTDSEAFLDGIFADGFETCN